MPLPKPFSTPFQKNQTVIYIFFWGLDIRKAPQLKIRSYEELWNKYWRLVNELIGPTATPALKNYIGKNDQAEADYQKALINLFESGKHPNLYPIPITSDTTLLLMALGWDSYEKEYKETEKETTDEDDEAEDDDSSLDEPIVKPAAKPKAKTNLKPTAPSKGKVTKPTQPAKSNPPLPRVSLIPFPERKGFPYALLGDTKSLKEYLRFPDSENKIAGYVSNVNGRFGPGWNLKSEAAEKIRESNGVDLELVEYESVWEYEKMLE